MDRDRDMSSFSRRSFMQTVAAAGAGLAAAGAMAQQQPDADGKKPAELKIAIIGAGSQGRNLLLNCLKIPAVRFVAVCDCWPYSQTYAANILRKYDQPANVYADYQDMLEREKDLDAVIVATPDWVHAEQTIACLKAGKHVYCEKEMCNTIEGARAMVKAAKETGKLLQIGHQRRSNPRYWHAMKMIHNDRVLGRITHCYGQWNRSRRQDIGWPKDQELDKATLAKYGYETMDQFRNWRWYRKYGGGAMADLGSHQVDVFGWFLKARPTAVLAAGGLDYYKDREWYDNVMAIYEYATEQGIVRAFYQVLNTTSYGGFYEVFMGDEGTIEISEDTRRGLLFRELEAKRKDWENEASKIESMNREAIQLKIGETLTSDGTPTPEGQKMLEEIKKPVHQLHLENFIDAIREGKPLSCPPDVAFETCVAVLRANEAVAAGKRLQFTAEDFRA